MEKYAYECDDENTAYWRGVRDAVSYFKEDLGIEDAEETTLANWAREELGEDCFDTEYGEESI